MDLLEWWRVTAVAEPLSRLPLDLYERRRGTAAGEPLCRPLLELELRQRLRGLVTAVAEPLGQPPLEPEPQVWRRRRGCQGTPTAPRALVAGALDGSLTAAATGTAWSA